MSRFAGHNGLIFREDQFDAITRTRRGRLYEGGRHSQPTTDFYVLPHPHEIPTGHPLNAAGAKAELFVYVTPAEYVTNPSKLHGAVLALGTSDFETRWRVIGLEMVGYGDLLLTLRARSAMGILPDLENASIPLAARGPVGIAVEDVISAAFRESSGSVVDKCRHALVTIISSWLYEHGEGEGVFNRDLGALCKILWRTGRRMLAANAWVVARLHNNTKPSSRTEHGLQAPVPDDADYCIYAVGLVLRELHWTVDSSSRPL